MTITRRGFVRTLGAMTFGPAARVSCAQAVHMPSQPPAPGYAFFGAEEARFVETACARLIPALGDAAGALEAGAPRYIDAQLAGPWGSGHVRHRPGLWQPGTDDRQFPAPGPAAYVRTLLGATCAALRRRRDGGEGLAALPDAAQDAFLESLRTGTAHLGVPSEDFFALLLQMTVEGYLVSSLPTATCDRIAWPLGRCPGALASTRS